MTSISSQARPPQSVEEALFLAALGTEAIPLLRYDPQRPTKLAIACIHALGMASRSPHNFEDFLQPLRAYEQDSRKAVQKACQQMVRKLGGSRALLPKYLWQPYFIEGIEVNGATTLEWIRYLACWPSYGRSITLRNSSIASLQQMTNLPDLEKLHLVNLPVDDLSPLATLQHLHTLTLGDLPLLEDLSPLADFPQLTALTLGGHLPMVKDLSPLGKLQNLTTLHLNLHLHPDEHHCNDLSFLATLRGLRTLFIQGHPTSSLTLPSALTYLSLYLCPKLTDYAFLSALTNVTTLSLSSCAPIEDSTPLGNMTALSKLILRYTACRDCSPLANLPNLVDVALSRINEDMDLSPLAASRSLRRLSIESDDNAGMGNISVLGNSPSLRKLELVPRPFSSRNEHIDLTPLCQAPALQYVNISAYKGERIKGVSELQKRGVILNSRYTPDIYK